MKKRREEQLLGRLLVDPRLQTFIREKQKKLWKF